MISLIGGGGLNIHKCPWDMNSNVLTATTTTTKNLPSHLIFSLSQWFFSSCKNILTKKEKQKDNELHGAILAYIRIHLSWNFSPRSQNAHQQIQIVDTVARDQTATCYLFPSDNLASSLVEDASCNTGTPHLRQTKRNKSKRRGLKIPLWCPSCIILSMFCILPLTRQVS